MDRGMAAQSLRTTRAASARRLIEWSLSMLYAGEFDCGIALAGESEALLSDGLPQPYLSQILGEFPGASLRQADAKGEEHAPSGAASRFDVADWLRRSTEAVEVEVTELDATILVLRAILAFDAACGGPQGPFAEFRAWAVGTYPELRAWAQPGG